MPRKGFRLEQSDVLDVMREVGTARLDDLAEHLGWHEATVRRSADGLAHQGKLRVISGRRAPGRTYIYGDGSPEQGMES